MICILILSGCAENSKNSNLELDNFIKPKYSFKESSFSCKLVSGQTLNSVERFIPQFVDSYVKMGRGTEELYFLFPVTDDKTDTQSFNLLLQHDEIDAVDSFNLTLAALSFDDIAICNSAKIVRNSLRLTSNKINKFPVVSEVLQCNYKDGFNYATIKLVLEQFSDALVKNNSPVDIIYSEGEGPDNSFQWTNIFLSLESRKDFVNLWQTLDISKEIQELLIEQSTCQSSKVYRQYKVL